MKNKANKFLSTILSFAMIIALLPTFTLPAKATSGDWGSNIATVGIGDITISTAAELARFAANVTAGYT